MIVLFQLPLLMFVFQTYAEQWNVKETRTYTRKRFISSGVNHAIVGSTEPCSSALRCLQRCSQSDRYRSFYFSVVLQQCYCNTQLDCGANTTDLDTGLVYGIRNALFERAEYKSFEKFHILPEEKDCLSLYQKGFSKDGVYVIYPVSGTPVEAWCDMTGGGWTVIQRRQDGSEDFYRIWDDYVNGFGNRTGEYWMGLENIRIMTTMASTLRIELETFGDVTPSSAFAEYSSFAIGSSATNYQLTVSGFSGNCGDSLTPWHNEMAFTTRDRKNDVYTDNCAVVYAGAWWYKDCHQSNLNGMYLGNNTSVYAKGITWFTCWGYSYSAKTSVMKIRRNV